MVFACKQSTFSTDTTNPETSKVNMSISKWQKSKPVSKWNNPSDTLVDKLNNKTIIAPTMTINKC